MKELSSRPVENRELNSRPLENVVTRASELIGHTPLFELCSTESGTRLLLKLEQFNPTGSTKVRMAEQMIKDAERRGQLRPGGHIIEPTSGNTGLGLALMAIERGYRFTAVVDRHASADKLRAMEAMGAKLVYVGGDSTDGPSTVERRRVARELAAAEEGGGGWINTITPVTLRAIANWLKNSSPTFSAMSTT